MLFAYAINLTVLMFNYIERKVIPKLAASKTFREPVRTLPFMSILDIHQPRFYRGTGGFFIPLCGIIPPIR